MIGWESGAPAPTPYERASGNDLMHLAYDRADAPAQVGAVLVLCPLGEPPTVGAVRAALAERIAAVPRLRRRLQPVPLGSGRPIWVDDPGFDIDGHVERASWPPPYDEAALLELAVATVQRPLPRDRPLWSITLVTGARDGSYALVVRVHHTLADGQSAIGLLGCLADGGSRATRAAGFPLPPPERRVLAAEALRARLAGVAAVRVSVPNLLRAAAELRLTRMVPAPRCSLNRPTGPRRRLATARVDLALVRAAARARGASLNDAVLTASLGALRALLLDRGEAVGRLVVAVFVSGRSRVIAGGLGNQVGVVPLSLPAAAASPEALREVAGITGAALRRAAAPTPRPGMGARRTTASLLEPLFRTAGRLGVTKWYFNRQRRVNVFVTTLRGPAAEISMFGHPVRRIIPIANTSGNVSVVLTALSYAGSLVVSVLSDPDACPDADRLVGYLTRAFTALSPPMASE